MGNILRKFIYSITFLIILTGTCLVCKSTVSANESSVVRLKVGFYELDGFFGYDSNNNECGYGVDYSF